MSVSEKVDWSVIQYAKPFGSREINSRLTCTSSQISSKHKSEGQVRRNEWNCLPVGHVTCKFFLTGASTNHTIPLPNWRLLGITKQTPNSTLLTVKISMEYYFKNINLTQCTFSVYTLWRHAKTFHLKYIKLLRSNFLGN